MATSVPRPAPTTVPIPAATIGARASPAPSNPTSRTAAAAVPVERRDDVDGRGGDRRPVGQQVSQRDDDEDGDRRNRRRRRDRRGSNRDRDRRAGGGNRDRVDEPSVTEDDVLIPVAGILDILDNYAFVRTSGYLPGPNDVYVSLAMVRRNGLRKGDAVTGVVRQPREGENSRSSTLWSASTPLTVRTPKPPSTAPSSPS